MTEIAEAPNLEKFKWSVKTTVEKWDRSEDHDAGLPPDDIYEGEGNQLVNVGIDRLLDQLIGATTSPYNNTNCRIGVGDSSTAFAASQTDLQAATNKLWNTMDATFPSRSAETVTFKATFATGDANFVWNEWAIDRGTAQSTTVTSPMLNRKVQSMGTKASGSTWALTVTITVA